MSIVGSNNHRISFVEQEEEERTDDDDAERPCVDPRNVVLKSSVSSSLKQNYNVAYLHAMSLPGTLINILMHPGLLKNEEVNVERKCCDAADHSHDHLHDQEPETPPAALLLASLVEEKRSIPEWGQVDLNAVLAPCNTVGEIYNTAKCEDAAELSGYLRGLSNALPKPQLFELTAPGGDSRLQRAKSKPINSVTTSELFGSTMRYCR